MKRSLEVAAWAFVAATFFGSAVSIRERIPGRPLGIQVPISVPKAVFIGWGAGVAAPWPMPLAALIAARLSRKDGGTAGGAVCAGLGALCAAGTLVEPVTLRPRSWNGTVRIAIFANIVTAAGLIAAGFDAVKHSMHSADPCVVSYPGPERASF